MFIYKFAEIRNHQSCQASDQVRSTTYQFDTGGGGGVRANSIYKSPNFAISIGKLF